ncbi:MAG: sigma-70 family RNA polymerase sigma factor, partial [Zavarzinella sp.]|nr:sigma-70 family RNA polymerase sigma factor [Zavarzinella sp.]
MPAPRSCSPARTVRRFLAQVAPAPDAGDAELLSQFLAGDHEAFAVLVRRHGPMVLGVCRRGLGPGPDSDDAFQATFLALARHARQVRGRDDLGAWLHRVALHACHRARARRAKTESVELPDVPGPNSDPLADLSWREVRRMLDEELNRLPGRLRAPLVACYLDGQTREEAARRLGWSASTLKRRLRRGLDVLRARLTRRGIAPAAVG